MLGAKSRPLESSQSIPVAWWVLCGQFISVLLFTMLNPPESQEGLLREGLQNPLPKGLGLALIVSEFRWQPWEARGERARVSKALSAPSL